MSKDEKWALAKLMFEQGKSLGEISLETGINKGSISRMAKAEGWIKGGLQPLIQDAARVQREFATLTQPQQHLVAAEVKRINKYKDLRDTAADILFNRIITSLPSCEVNEIKPLGDALDKVCITAEIAPRFNPATVINNTNAQQNVMDNNQLLKSISECLPN